MYGSTTGRKLTQGQSHFLNEVIAFHWKLVQLVLENEDGQADVERKRRMSNVYSKDWVNDFVEPIRIKH